MQRRGELMLAAEQQDDRAFIGGRCASRACAGERRANRQRASAQRECSGASVAVEASKDSPVFEPDLILGAHRRGLHRLHRRLDGENAPDAVDFALINVLSGKYNEAVNTRDMARLLGRRGGRARARNLTAEQRRQIAALGGAARRRSLDLARRHADNFTYAAVVLELQPPPRVQRMRTFNGPLPGLYPDKTPA